jgi:arylsulfatase A-like enzyme
MSDITRRSLLAPVSGALFARQSSQRPNIICIMTDDQGYGDVGANGSPDAQTPHIDRLARSGIRFTDWHSNSPVCSPSRASLLTGQYPQHCGIPAILASRPSFDVPGLKAGQKTLATELRALGYRTAAVGKWHLGSAAHSRPLAQGFDEFFGFYSGWTDYYSHRYYQLGGQPIFHDLWRNEQEVFEEPAYQTELLGREARSFVGRPRPDSQPFFLYLAFGAPHYPMMAPASYLSRFPAGMDRDRREHLAMCAAIDDQVGSLMSVLEQRGLRDNTIVYYQADNGATSEVRADHLARPYRGGSNGRYRAFKGSLFEGGIRIPALLSWPARLRSGQVRNEAGAAMDMLPTLLRWAGGQAPADVDGADLSAPLMDRTNFPSRDLFWNYAGQTAIRRGQWKLIDNHREGLGQPLIQEKWLSNLDADPGESRNAAAAEPERVRQMSEAMDAFRKRLPMGPVD